MQGLAKVLYHKIPTHHARPFRTMPTISLCEDMRHAEVLGAGPTMPPTWPRPNLFRLLLTAPHPKSGLRKVDTLAAERVQGVPKPPHTELGQSCVPSLHSPLQRGGAGARHGSLLRVGCRNCLLRQRLVTPRLAVALAKWPIIDAPFVGLTN